MGIVPICCILIHDAATTARRAQPAEGSAMKLDMLIRQFDPTLLPKMILGGLRHSDGSGTWDFFIENNDRRTKRKVERMLKKNGIDSWGWGATMANNWMFSVRRSQAEQAEVLMKQNGVQVNHVNLT